MAENEENEQVTVDIRDLYKFDPSKLALEISEEIYSNLAYLQATDRDMYIDFLAMPGIKKEGGNMVVNGVRIFMSHMAAQRLAEALVMVLEKRYQKGGMESYTPEKTEEIEPMTVISRTVKEEQA